MSLYWVNYGQCSIRIQTCDLSITNLESRIA
jgi:hypothetical protein